MLELKLERVPIMRFWWDQFRSDRAALWGAAEEVLIVCLFSLLPLILLPFIEHLTKEADNVFAPGALVVSAISGGQLYLYSFSLFGSLFWLCQKEFPNIDRFTPRKWFMMLIIMPIFVIFGVYIVDPSLRKPLSSTLIFSSIAIYTIYVVIYFILTVFDNLKAPVVQADLAKGVGDLKSKYRNLQE